MEEKEKLTFLVLSIRHQPFQAGAEWKTFQKVIYKCLKSLSRAGRSKTEEISLLSEIGYSWFVKSICVAFLLEHPIQKNNINKFVVASNIVTFWCLKCWQSTRREYLADCAEKVERYLILQFQIYQVLSAARYIIHINVWTQTLWNKTMHREGSTNKTSLTPSKIGNT